MTPRALGLRRDRGVFPREPFAALRGLGAEPRGHANLLDFVPAIVDQGHVGHCTTAVMMAIATTLAAAGTPLGFVPSQLVAYQLALRLDRAADHPGVPAAQLPDLRDVGSTLYTMAAVATRYGVAPMRGTAANDCTTANACDERAVAVDDVIAAARAIVVGPYEITGTAATRLRAAKLALDAGIAVSIGGFVDTAYMGRDAASKPAGAQDTRDPDGGGHAQYLAAYDDGAGSTLWAVVGSWGADWGDAGVTIVTDAFVAQQWEMMAAKARLA